MSIQRLTQARSRPRLELGGALLLDVWRSGALVRDPQGIGGAVPVLPDEGDPRIPDQDRSRTRLAYCLCSGQASSTRVA